MRYAVLMLGAVLILPGCSQTVTTVRTITPEEYAAQSWLGHSAGDVALAWGENLGGEPDGAGGRLLTYRMVSTNPTAPTVPVPLGAIPSQGGSMVNDPNPGVSTYDVARFWIGTDGKVYRYWFADEVYKRHLDSPGARPVDHYGKTTR